MMGATFNVVEWWGPDDVRVISTHHDRTVAIMAAIAAGAVGDPFDFKGRRVIFGPSGGAMPAIYVDTVPAPALMGKDE